MSRFGAEEADWDAWVEIGVGEYLLPAVGNPNATISPNSKIKDVGKTPSVYNAQGQAVGMAGWTSHVASDGDIARWKRQPDYSLCLQTAGPIKAIDIDVADRAKAQELRRTITDIIGPTPVRYRANSGKCLLPFRLEGEMPKRVLPVDGGMIEFLGTGQQFVGHGLHPSGERYQWNGTALPDVPTLDADGLEALWDALVLVHGTGEPRIARTRRAGSGGDGAGLDETGRWLLDNWSCHDVEQGRIYLVCPFEAGHSTLDNGTGTAYFSAGTGGYEQGHWRCLHASCEGRTDADFLEATGYSASQFSDLSGDAVAGADTEQAQSGLVVEAGLSPLSLVRDKHSKIEPTAENLLALCAAPSWIGKRLAFDTFANELVWCLPGEAEGEEQWRKFGDDDTFDVRVQLERRGMKPMSPDLLRSAIHRAARLGEIDTAQVWLGRLRWDGVERVAGFAARAWGWMPGAYAEAVSRYVWTGLAGRVLEPGCQCDMAPVLVGAQGLRKTTAIKAMVPSPSHYVTLPLDAHDNDTARQLRGKLVAELEELRGLNTRSIEAIKAWITKTHEEWIVKFKEFGTTFARRLLFFGTTNDEEFLNDPTGERRFLPGWCHGPLDVDWIRENRDQLWAEGAVLFALDGVAWEDAERLAKHEHDAFKVSDAWEQPVARWLAEKPVALDGSGKSPIELGYVVPADALEHAVHVPKAQHDRVRVLRMGKVLGGLGWTQGRFYTPDGERVRGYLKPSS